MDLSEALRVKTTDHKRTLSHAPSIERSATKEFRALTQKEVERAVLGEAARQLKDDSSFGWHVATRVFGYSGAAGTYAYRAIWKEYLSGRAFRYRAQQLSASLSHTIFHTRRRAEHVYAETPADVPRLMAPV